MKKMQVNTQRGYKTIGSHHKIIHTCISETNRWGVRKAAMPATTASFLSPFAWINLKKTTINCYWLLNFLLTSFCP